MNRIVLGCAGMILAGTGLAAIRGDGLALEAGETHVGPSTVYISVLLTNTTRSPVALDAQPVWQDRCGLSMTITGQGKAPRAVPNDLTPCSESREVIQPGNSLAASRTLTRSEWFPAPGKYTVHVAWKEPTKGTYQNEPITIEIR